MNEEERKLLSDAVYIINQGKARSILPRVVAAAVLMNDGLIVSGVRHFSPDMRDVLVRIYGDRYVQLVNEKGFIDSHGNFLSRKDAWTLADANGQIFIYDPGGTGALIPQPANEGEDGMLFSENLY